MSGEELAHACLLPGFPGATVPDWVRRRLARGLGGVLYFARNVADPEQLTQLSAAVCAEKADVLIGIDEEGGDVTRLEAATGSSYPGNLALGAADDPELTRAVGVDMGAALVAAGVNLNLAPVADLADDPYSPVVGPRSFGADPRHVAVHVAAMVEGLQSMGVAACVKHFPGHGGTAEDSHLALPTVAATASELWAGALVPFRAAIAAGVRSIMTTHVRVLAYDEAPATLSRAVLTGLLREELAFDGLVVTDALEMRAISDAYGMPDAAVRALAAGADLLCLGAEIGEEDVEEVVRGVLRAVRGGRLAEERLAEAAGRVARVAAWAGRGTAPAYTTDPTVGLAAARRALRVTGAVPRLAASDGAPLVVELWPEPSLPVLGVRWGLGDHLRERDPRTEVVRLTAPPSPTELDALMAGRPVLFVVRDLHRHAWQQRVAAEALARRPDAVVVEMGLPVRPPEGVTSYLATYGAGRVNAVAAVQLLLDGDR